MIQFDVLHSSLAPLRHLAQASKAAKGSSQRPIDLRITPLKGAQGNPDTLRFEIFKNGFYGVVEIHEGVQIHKGSEEPIHLESRLFLSLPENPQPQVPLRMSLAREPKGKAPGELLVHYPDEKGQQETHFSIEVVNQPSYIENPWSFPEIQGHMNADELKQINTVLQEAGKNDKIIQFMVKDGILHLEVSSADVGIFFKMKTPTFKSDDFAKHISVSSIKSVIGFGVNWGHLDIGLSETQLFARCDNHLVLLDLPVDQNRVEINVEKASDFERLINQVNKYLADGSKNILSCSINPAKLLKQIETIGKPVSHHEDFSSLEIIKNNNQTRFKITGIFSEEASFAPSEESIKVAWGISDKFKYNLKIFKSALKSSVKFGINKLYILDGDSLSGCALFKHATDDLAVLIMQIEDDLK